MPHEPRLEQGLLAHWPLETDHHNRSPHELSSTARRVTFEPCDGRPAARFNGVDSQIEVASHAALNRGQGDFTLALWLHSADSAQGGDIVGDLINKFDPQARRGLNLTVQTQSGVTQTTQANYRQLQFGIDHAQADPRWTDCGQPGHAVKISALATVNGALYAGAFENDAHHTGHLWRYEADNQWTDLGATPTGCNNVTSLAFFNGALHAATGRYCPRGSMLGLARNHRPGGVVYRIEPDGRWVSIGHPGLQGAKPDDFATAYGASDQADETLCLTVYRGQLYGVSHHRRGIYRYEGGQEWKWIGPDQRIMSITLHAGQMYALINGPGMYRYEGGSDWTWQGDPPRSQQSYCSVTHQGRLLVGTWPEGEIVRHEGGEAWSVIGRLGHEREVMGAAVYNGKCYFGSLPMANVYRMDGEAFTFFGNLDSAESPCRRVWSMATHAGQLFAGTLPQGRVFRRQMGRVTTHDHALPAGWRHIAAVRQGDRLTLHLDGQLVAQSATLNPADYDLDNTQPLRIGGGIGHALNGALRDVRLYDRALANHEIQTLARD